MAKPQPCYELAAFFMAAQMAQENVAIEILGCVPSTLSNYMNAKQPFPVMVITKLSLAFNIPPSKWGDVFVKPYAIANGLLYYTVPAA